MCCVAFRATPFRSRAKRITTSTAHTIVDHLPDQLATPMNPLPPTSSEAAPSNPLPPADVERYSRQLLLPSFGVASQLSLGSSRALIVGAGGLGCPAALYLSGAGVGVLGLVDRPGEVVETSNLHRQIAHTTRAAVAGISKVDSARNAITALNPTVEVVQHTSFTPASAVALTSSYDVVLDCTDNVTSRYLVSDACAVTRTPLVSGAAIGLDGQLTLYCAGVDTPCYRCVFPTPPPPSCVGSCDSAGVLGPVPGVIGTLMALEAIKVLSKMRGTVPLAGLLLLFDGANAEFRRVKLRGRNSSCVACGDGASLDVASFDYATFVQGGISAPPPVLDDEFRISVHQLANMREKREAGHADFLLLDVRPETQFAMCALSDARNVPLVKLDEHFASDLKKLHTPIVVLCRRGNSSQVACAKLRSLGITQAVDVRGGLQAWHREIDKDFPLY